MNNSDLISPYKFPENTKSWCKSEIGQHLWNKGKLFPPLINQINLRQAVSSFESFNDFQGNLRLPIRLACYLSINASLDVSYSRRISKETALTEKLGKSFLGDYKYKETLEKVKIATKFRSDPALIYGQRFITPESAVCRAALIANSLKTVKSRVVFLGDDDLASIAFALIAPSCEITVIDIDKKIIEAIQTSANEFSINIETFGFDLLGEVPDNLKNRFDCFVGDPYPSSDASFEMLFVKKGIEFLDPLGSLLGVVTFAPSHKSPAFREVILNQITKEFTIHNIFEDACDYELINGELTTVEYEYLDSVAEIETLISHCKSYLFISPRKLISPEPLTEFNLVPWLRSTRSHDLSLRLGGDERLRSELHRTVDYEEWSKAFEENENINYAVNLYNLLIDLSADEQASQLLAGLTSRKKFFEFQQFFNKVFEGEKFLEECRYLLTAACEGPVTSYKHHSLEFELYLIGRIYESYYRGASPLRAG